MQKRVLKKLFLALMVISLLLSVFSIGKILAAEPTFILSDAEIEDKSSGVEASIEEFTSNELITNTTFHKINDYVKYRLTIKNTSDTKYKLVLVNDNNSNENVTYEYDYNENEELLPGNTLDVMLTITYKEGIEQIDQRTQDQEVKISFIVEDENGNNYEEDITINPQTSDNIFIHVAMAIASLLAILALVFKKKISKLFILLVLVIPMITYAVTPSLIVVLKNNTKLFDKMVVYKDVNGVNEAVLVDYNTPYERPADPQKPGYNFDNWYVGDDVYNFDTPLTEDIELTAKFNIITYDITYDLNGGSVSGNPTTYNVETETFTLNNPTKDGYTFTGWTGSNGDELQTTVTIEKGSIDNKSYVAHFEANSNIPYTVNHKYKKLNGDFDVETEHLEGTTDDVIKPAIKHKDGFVDPSLKEITITADGNAYVDYEYIREQYVLTLENIEDINTEFTSGLYDYETQITLTAKNKDHYDFVKWSNNETSNPLVFNISENTTIGPIYQIKQYTVSFDEQGGLSVEDITKDYNSEIGTLPTSEKSGYLFDGWYTSQTDGEKINADTKITKDITYYAHWTKSLELATVSPESITLLRGQTTTISVTGVEEEYTITSNDSSVVTIDNNVVTAVGKGTTTITVRGTRSEIEKEINVTVNPIMYTINYDSQGGSAVDSVEKEENTKLGTLPITEKTDYVLDGWYTKKTGGEKISDQTDVTKTTTYYAHWLKSMSLSSVTPDSITIYEDETANITVTNVEEEISFTSNNEEIATVNNNGVVTGVKKGSTTIKITGVGSNVSKTVDVTVIAGTNTVTFDTRGGSSVASIDVEDNNAIGTLPTTERENYEFEGWYTSANGGTKITSSTIVTDDVTYYAHWNQIDLDLTKVFYIPGSCTFDGSITTSEIGNITSDSPQGCVSTINPSGNDIDYTDVKYIDSKISLFSSDNFEKDFELGFTLNEFVTNSTVDKQGTIVNSKLENSTEKYPGFVIRKNSSTTKVEVAEKFGSDINYGELFTYHSGMNIRVSRQDGVMFYSIDGGKWVSLQDIKSYSKRFNLTTWFGAMSKETSMTATGEGSTADRYFKGNISDVYIKLETESATKHTVTFDSKGGTAVFTTKQVKDGNKIYGLPSVTKTNMELEGWYTDDTYTTKVTEDTIITEDVTFVAKWMGLNVIARVDDTEFVSLQDAIDSTRGSETKKEITILNDLTISEKLIIHEDNNVEFDLQDYTFTSSNVAIFENYGTLTIKNGTLINSGKEPRYSINNTSTGVVYITGGTIRATASNAIANAGRMEISGGNIIGTADAAPINNNEGGVLIISGGSVTATNTNKGQAVYNNGGTVTVMDGAYLENNSLNRAALHNNVGTINILGGTIVAKNYSAVLNNDTMTIGDDSDPINTTSPVLQGKTYGLEITSGKTVTVYDGIFKGITSAINDLSKVTHNTNVDFNTSNTETIGSDTYNVAYLEEQ